MNLLPDRQQAQIHALVPMQVRIELPQRDSVDIRIRGVGDPPGPEGIVDDDQTADPDEFQRTLMDELIIIPIFRRYTFTAVYDRWGNVNWDVNHSFGDNYTRLYLK